MRTFTCPSCRSSFPWKDGYINRKVSCRCGCVFEAFENPPDEPDPVNPYDIADDSPGAAVPPAPTVAHTALPQTQFTPYPTRRDHPAPMGTDTDHPSAFRDVILPGTLLILGIAIMIGQGITSAQGNDSALRLIALNAVFLSLMVLTMMGGGAIAGGLIGIEFGSIGSVLFKFAATGVFAASVALVVAGLDKSDSLTGPVVAWNLLVILYWICFHLLFELDLQENLLTVAIIAFMQAAVGCILWTI